MTVPELTKEMFDAKNMMTACDPRYGRYLYATNCNTCSAQRIIGMFSDKLDYDHHQVPHSGNYFPWQDVHEGGEIIKRKI